MTSNGVFQPLGKTGLLVSWLLPATAILGVNTCLVISISTGAIEPTIPYLDGDVSISKACRQPYSRALFRTIAVALAAMGGYWWHSVGSRLGKPGKAARALGIVAILSFLLYAFVLGEIGHHLTRRIAVYSFLAFTILAEVLVAHKLRLLQPSSRACLALAIYTYSLVPVCIGLLPAGGLILGNWDKGENLAEWITFLLMLAFFPFAGMVCRKVGFIKQLP